MNATTNIALRITQAITRPNSARTNPMELSAILPTYGRYSRAGLPVASRPDAVAAPSSAEQTWRPSWQVRPAESHFQAYAAMGHPRGQAALADSAPWGSVSAPGQDALLLPAVGVSASKEPPTSVRGGACARLREYYARLSSQQPAKADAQASAAEQQHEKQSASLLPVDHAAATAAEAAAETAHASATRARAAQRVRWADNPVYQPDSQASAEQLMQHLRGDSQRDSQAGQGAYGAGSVGNQATVSMSSFYRRIAANPCLAQIFASQYSKSTAAAERADIWQTAPAQTVGAAADTIGQTAAGAKALLLEHAAPDALAITEHGIAILARQSSLPTRLFLSCTLHP